MDPSRNPRPPHLHLWKRYFPSYTRHMNRLDIAAALQLYYVVDAETAVLSEAHEVEAGFYDGALGEYDYLMRIDDYLQRIWRATEQWQGQGLSPPKMVPNLMINPFSNTFAMPGSVKPGLGRIADTRQKEPDVRCEPSAPSQNFLQRYREMRRCVDSILSQLLWKTDTTQTQQDSAALMGRMSSAATAISVQRLRGEVSRIFLDLLEALKTLQRRADRQNISSERTIMFKQYSLKMALEFIVFSGTTTSGLDPFQQSGYRQQLMSIEFHEYQRRLMSIQGMEQVPHLGGVVSNAGPSTTANLTTQPQHSQGGHQDAGQASSSQVNLTSQPLNTHNSMEKYHSELFSAETSRIELGECSQRHLTEIYHDILASYQENPELQQQTQEGPNSDNLLPEQHPQQQQPGPNENQTELLSATEFDYLLSLVIHNINEQNASFSATSGNNFKK